MLRNVILFLVFPLIFSCDYSKDGVADVESCNSRIHNISNNNTVDSRHKLLEFAVGRGTLHSNRVLTVGPIEILGNNGVTEGLRSHNQGVERDCYSPRLIQSRKSLCFDVDNIRGDSAMMLIHYTYMSESDTSYDVTEGILYLPIENSTKHKVLFNSHPFKSITTKGIQSIILDIDNLFLW